MVNDMTELVFRDDAYAASCAATVTAVDERGIRLDRTVFYPLGGGQAGDAGVLVLPDGSEVRIVDAVKGEGAEEVVHVPAPGSAPPAVGTPVEARLDWERRHRLMRLHTCLHLLCAVVPAPVSGGKIGEDKAHLDFDIEMEKLDRDGIEARLNALIEAGHAVAPRWISDEELEARPELVRTMSVKPPRGQGRVRVLDIPGVDLQPCGGTHVRDTREIGRVQVVKIKSEGKRNRRVTVALAK